MSVGESVYFRRTRAPRLILLKSSRISVTYARAPAFLGRTLGRKSEAGAVRIQRS